MGFLRELCALAPHRLAGSPGAERAVEWAVSAMQRIGLENVRKEEVLVPHWVRGEVCEVTMLGAGYEERLKALALGGSVGTPPEGLVAEVVPVRSFEQLRALGEAARGKIVFFDRPMPRILANTFLAYRDSVDQRASGAVEAAKVGALGALVRSMTTSLDDLPHTGSLQYDDALPRIPALALSTVASERLAMILAGDPRTKVRIRLDCETLPDVPSANVVGEIVGSGNPKEVVLIGAHLDAWDVGEGAHDDAAGCAHCLEAARLILASGVRPARTIRVVLFMNEENGLRGASGYLARHEDELAQHVAAVESDRGGFLPLGFTSSLEGERLEALRDAMAPLEDWAITSLIRGGGGADIGMLGARGVPVFELLVSSQRYFDHHHCDRDRVETVNERELALGAASLAYLAAWLAES
jgi:Iap family predicted aminopeptidase